MRKHLFYLIALVLLLASPFAVSQPSSRGIVSVTDNTDTVYPWQIFMSGANVEKGTGGKANVIFVGGAGGGSESTTVSDTTTINLTLTGSDITADGLYTAGDALTLTGADFDFDGGASPGGELGGTWASPTIDDSLAVTSWNLTTPTITTSLTTSTPTTLTAAELDRLDGLTSAIIDDDKIDTFAELDAIVADKVLVETTTAMLGDVTGNFGATVIADSVTVTGWVMGASTATTPAADDNDTSLATSAYVQTELNAAGGRSLTCASGSCDVDAEVYEQTKCIYWENPVAGDDFKSVYIFKTAATITQVFCESDQTVNMTIQEDDGTPADIETTDFVCDATPPTQTTGFEDAAMAAGSRLDFDVTSVSGSPTWCSFCFSFTQDD